MMRTYIARTLFSRTDVGCLAAGKMLTRENGCRSGIGSCFFALGMDRKPAVFAYGGCGEWKVRRVGYCEYAIADRCWCAEGQAAAAAAEARCAALEAQLAEAAAAREEEKRREAGEREALASGASAKEQVRDGHLVNL